MWPNCCHDQPLNKRLVVTVQDIKPFRDLRFHHGETQTMGTIYYNFCTDFATSDSNCAIIPHSMPSLDDIHVCIFDADHSCNSGPFAGLNIAFGKFAGPYCGLDVKLPLVSRP